MIDIGSTLEIKKRIPLIRTRTVLRYKDTWTTVPEQFYDRGENTRNNSFKKDEKIQGILELF